MEAACRRLCQGDNSSLPDIIDAIDAGLAPPTEKVGARVLSALATILLREGTAIRGSLAPESRLPSESAVYALRILALLGVRFATEGHEVKSLLLSLGLQRCRDMALDAYFGLPRAQRYYAIMFITLLTNLYGCCPNDLLLSTTSLNIFSGVEDAWRDSPQRGNRTDASAHRPASSRHERVRNSPALSPSRGDFPPPRHGDGPHGAASARRTSPSRRNDIPNRSDLQLSIPGTSADLPVQPPRWYRELPRKAINAPFPINPLYVKHARKAGDESAWGAGDGGGGGDVEGRRSLPVTPMQTLELAITAQFPTPVLMFAAHYGVGCIPRVPTMADLHLLNAWRQATHPAQPGEVKGPPIISTHPIMPSRERKYGWDFVLNMASQLLDPGATTSTTDKSPYPPALQNEAAFTTHNTSVLLHHRKCMGCPLLQLYLEDGKLLSWGCSAKGALGPRRGRQRQGTAIPSKATVSAHGRIGSPSGGEEEDDTTHSREGTQVSCSNAPLCTPGHPPVVTPASSRGPSPTRPGKVVPALPRSRGITDDPLADSAAAVTRPQFSAPSTARGASTAAPDNSMSTDYTYLPTLVHTPVRVAQIACGLAVTYIVTVSGVLCSCGRADSGQLGIGERSTRYAAAGSAKFQNVVFKEEERTIRVAAGTASAVALVPDNILYVWGHNIYGQCMRMGDVSRVLTPVRLKLGMAQVVDVCFGQSFGAVLFADGVVGTWGASSMLGWQISEDALEPSLAPDHSLCARRIVPLRTADMPLIVAVRAGTWHVLAVSQQGEVYTWGVGRNGRLGHGSDESEVRPRLVEGLRSCFVVDASCSTAHTMVLSSTGTVYAFGENSEGQLGLQGDAPRRIPTAVSLPVKAIAVACAREHTCILLEDGDVVACGSFRTCGSGLGYGRRFCAPVRILSNYLTLTLGTGHLHTMAGVVQRRTAVLVVGHSNIEEVSRVSSLVVRNGVRCAAAGAGFLVALSENNSLVAMGRGERGQLGIGVGMQPARPGDITVSPGFAQVLLPPGLGIQRVYCGPDYVMALDGSGAVYGWGSNEYRKLCQPSSVAHVFTPAQIADYASEHIVQMACGGSFVLALTADGEVLSHGEAVCCGLGLSISAAGAKIGEVPVPTRISGLCDIVAVAAGSRHAVAMTVSCSIFAWGVGVLGTGAPCDAASFTAVTPAPVRVALSQNIRTIGCGPHCSFAISAEGELWVWGLNRYGECGMPPPEGPPLGSEVGSKGLRPPPSENATAVASPISVARKVRDAAFARCFGLVVFESGEVKVSGRVRFGGQRYCLPSFHSEPQPAFAVHVNESTPRSPPSRAGKSPRQAQRIRSPGEERGMLSDADANDAAPPFSSRGSRRQSSSLLRLPIPPEQVALPSCTTCPGFRSQSPAQQRSHQALPPVQSGEIPPNSRTGPSQDALPTSTVRPSSTEARSELLFPATPRAEQHLLAPEGYGHDMASNCSLPSLVSSRKIPPESLRQSSTTVVDEAVRVEEARGGPRSIVHPGNDRVMRRRASEEDRSLTAEPLRTSPTEVCPVQEAKSGADRRTPYPPPASGNETSAAATSMTIAGVPLVVTPTSTTLGELPFAAPSLSSLPRYPPIGLSVQSSELGVGDAHPLAAPEQAGLGAVGSMASSPMLPATASISPPPSAWGRPHSRNTARLLGSAAVSATAATTTTTTSPRRPQQAAVASPPIFGIRCFPGWEQICVVVEKHRPSAIDVDMARTGLQVHLRQTEDPPREV